MIDGKLLLVTNLADLTPAEIVQRYNSPAICLWALVAAICSSNWSTPATSAAP
jgi:hypothetical protein